MYETHKTAEGDTMLIAQMENDHLTNLIKRVCKRIKDARLMLDVDVKFDGSVLLSMLNPDFSQQRVVEEVTRSIKRDDEYLKPYIMEACLRNLNISKFLQMAYGRETMIQTNFKMLNQSSDDLEDDEESYEDDEESYNEFLLCDSDIF